MTDVSYQGDTMTLKEQVVGLATRRYLDSEAGVTCIYLMGRTGESERTIRSFCKILVSEGILENVLEGWRLSEDAEHGAQLLAYRGIQGGVDCPA
jgi:hypothetical protein